MKSSVVALFPLTSRIPLTSCPLNSCSTFFLSKSTLLSEYCCRPQTSTYLNVKTGWYHAREDTPSLLFFLGFKNTVRVSCLARYQPVLAFLSLVWRFSSGTVKRLKKADKKRFSLKTFRQKRHWQCFERSLGVLPEELQRRPPPTLCPRLAFSGRQAEALEVELRIYIHK